VTARRAGHDEWRRIAPGLESLDDADLIRGKVLTAFERAEETAALDNPDSADIQQLLTFVLVGAGTVGVEMASTLAEMSRMALTHDFRNIDPRSARILLYEGAAHTSHVSRSLIGQSATASRKPGRRSVHEHPSYQRR
jgi:NADH:ubiquinone reductase (H+-translocating)